VRLGGMLPGTRVLDTSSHNVFLCTFVTVHFFPFLLSFEEKGEKMYYNCYIFTWCRIEVVSI